MPYIYVQKDGLGRIMWRCCLNTQGKAPNCGRCGQCKAYTLKKRERCKNRTCFDSYCWLHLEKEFYKSPKAKDKTRFGLQIKTSQIPNAGKGLFATRNFKKGDKIMKLEFRKLKKKEIDKLYDYIDPKTQKKLEGVGPYSFDIVLRDGEIYFGDGACIRNAPSYANDLKKSANVQYKQENDGTAIVWLTVTKNIKAGDELFHSYGKNYWKNLNTNPHSLRKVHIRDHNPSGPRGVIVLNKKKKK